MYIDDKMLEKLEKLSALKIPDDKREEFKEQLSKIVDFVEVLNELNLDNLVSMAVIDLDFFIALFSSPSVFLCPRAHRGRRARKGPGRTRRRGDAPRRHAPPACRSRFKGVVVFLRNDA